MYALKEVVIYGHRKFDERMSQILKPSPQQLERDKLPNAIPSGPNVLAMVGWAYEKVIGKKKRERTRRKRALEEVRQKEAEYQQKWDALERKR